MDPITRKLENLREVIHCAEQKYGRAPGSVRLLAVSKLRTPEEIRVAAAAGQACFGENYLQEALEKIHTLDDTRLNWHFIGSLQANKARAVAQYFDWVHSIDRFKLARRLSEFRPAGSTPLNICIQVNISGEDSKSGIPAEQLPELARAVRELPRLTLRGLMTMPAQETDFERQRQPFRQLRACLERLNDAGYGLDTLSMGTSADLEAAIAEGSTLVRVGTAVFGERPAG